MTRKKRPFTLIGKDVVLKTRGGSIFAGTVESKVGTELMLSRSRRIWFWRGAFTLSEISLTGIDKAGSRVATEVPAVVVTDAVEILPLTPAAKERIYSCSPDGK